MSKKPALTILRDDRGRPAFAVVPWADYERLAATGDDDAGDLAAARHGARNLDRDRRAMRGAEEPFVPIAVTKAILAGASPLRAWRERVNLTQAELAARAGVSRAYLTQIETGARAGSPDVLSRLARALGVLIDDVMPDDSDPDLVEGNAAIVSTKARVRLPRR